MDGQSIRIRLFRIYQFSVCRPSFWIVLSVFIPLPGTLLAVELATNEAAMLEDIEGEPDVSLMASDDEACVRDARGPALRSEVGAVELVELSESEAAAWLLGVTSAEVAVNGVGPTAES